MKLEVQLFATLQPYLPAGADGDHVFLELPDGSTVANVQAALHIPADLPCLMVVNGHDAEPDQVLAPGDVLAMFPPLAGG